MKTLKQFLETVDAPTYEPEKDFVKLHTVDVIDDLPVSDKTKPEKDKSRKADDLVYESMDALIDEALTEGLSLKPGLLRFEDGSKKVITGDDIRKIESVYKTTSNKREMEQELMKSKVDFESLVSLGD